MKESHDGGSDNWNTAHGSIVSRADTLLYRSLDKLFKHEIIDGGGRCEYLHRWRMFSRRWLGIYLHHFVDSDWSRDFHDHPRRFISIGLWGGYTEERPRTPLNQHLTVRSYFRAPWLRTFNAHHIHRVILQQNRPCWTLVIVLRVTRPWGFWPDSWVWFKDYLESDRADDARIC